jgi:hypothetical protein
MKHWQSRLPTAHTVRCVFTYSSGLQTRAVYSKRTASGGNCYRSKVLYLHHQSKTTDGMVVMNRERMEEVELKGRKRVSSAAIGD